MAVWDSDEFLERVEEISGQNLFACYQCGKCSAGCPVGAEMPLLPHQVIRYVQVGAVSEVAGSKTVWLCASCGTCASRCPKGLDLSRVMEAIRVTLLREGFGQILSPEIASLAVSGMPQQALIGSFRKMSG